MITKYQNACVEYYGASKLLKEYKKQITEYIKKHEYEIEWDEWMMWNTILEEYQRLRKLYSEYKTDCWDYWDTPSHFRDWYVNELEDTTEEDNILKLLDMWDERKRLMKNRRIALLRISNLWKYLYNKHSDQDGGK